LKPPLPMTPEFCVPQLVPVLFAKIEFVISSVVSSASTAAPEVELPALLFEKVQLFTVPPWTLSIPPPLAETLPENVQLVTDNVPAAALKMAPPAAALFPTKVESVTVRMLLLSTPPPSAVVKPLAIVRLLSVSAPEKFRKTRFAPPPSMVIV
jgi:hypothetical protein